MAKRKATETFASAGRRSKKAKVNHNGPSFVWKPKDWALKKTITDDVSLLSSRTSSALLVVKKVLRRKAHGNPQPVEVRALSLLPTCNRVVNTLFYADRDPDRRHVTIIFEHYPLGDLADWKKANFDRKNFKPVPESYIWRFFVQMSQAIAFIQNRIGPSRDERGCLLHRDLKPKNFLVVANGTTYPSFKLHDFGCATTYSRGRARDETICGTYEWQPPENPKINTAAAEIWSLGACVHYLAIGDAPLQSIARYTVDTIIGNGGRHPTAAGRYATPARFYAARVPRQVTPINLTKQQQVARGMAPYINPRRAAYNHTYSDELNNWMQQTLRHNPARRPTATRLVSAMALEAQEMLKKMAGKAGLTDLEITYGT